MKTTADKKPWKRANPAKKGTGTTLTAASKAQAEAAAAKAGRPYPNLVDNMNAARKQNAKAKPARKRP